ncbi:MAG TPA: efflux RND transporter periplasmic adaptor subunit [Thermoanaerobaculaceae bacterium]|nr:efflux RND transporter periplasmic adaptor subunit [Thermoanaerobaculaceae bacterium]HPS78672.1 efflux RND transporter periplasmic adaptor subunit [Thermoanaerobaculaceae bacterium]
MRRATAVQIALMVILAVVLGFLVVSCGGSTQQTEKYHCPMHPTYIADRPGDCPICGMRLVPAEERIAPTTVPAYTCPMHQEVTAERPGRCPKCGMELVATGAVTPPAASESASQPPDRPSGTGAFEGSERKVLYYRNPMDPTVTSPVPAKDSMGMEYVPVYADEQAGTATGGIPGRANIQISSEGLRLSGVQTTLATRARLARTIRAVGTVTADETRIRHVHTKIPGWVERLFVNFTGQLVRKGEPILSIFSRELLATQEEYLSAQETSRRFISSDIPEVRKGGEDLVKAARRRLALFDVPDAFIDRLESTGQVQRSVTLEAPVSGFVAVKDVFEGQQIEPAMELFTIADLSQVWVEAEFYEYEAKALHLGQEATVSLPYDTSARRAGRIAFISPTINTDTRTLKVRLEFPNPGMALKPGMFANVELAVEGAEGVVVPDSALMDTGERQVVFVSMGGGRFEPREVTVGVRSSGKVLLASGVAPGEDVVIRANFLLDSESRLRAALSATGGVAFPPTHTSSPLPPGPPPLAPAKPALASPPPPSPATPAGDS